MVFTSTSESQQKMIERWAAQAESCSIIDEEYYNKYIVKRGLRDIDGMGVLVGLTEIGEVHSYIIDEIG